MHAANSFHFGSPRILGGTLLSLHQVPSTKLTQNPHHNSHTSDCVENQDMCALKSFGLSHALSKSASFMNELTCKLCQHNQLNTSAKHQHNPPHNYELSEFKLFAICSSTRWQCCAQCVTPVLPVVRVPLPHWPARLVRLRSLP